ncbi:MAG: tetratricopeptide repeat protein [Balneolaceae bacterium]|nr:tetratricopeptide repeat protein [Balneolaceae bacterium]
MMNMSSESDTNRIRQLARSVKENPEDSFSKFALALECRKRGRYEKARVLFEDIRRRDPGYVGVYYHLGGLYVSLGRTGDARTCYREGIEVAQRMKRTRTLTELREALQQLEYEIETRP